MRNKNANSDWGIKNAKDDALIADNISKKYFARLYVLLHMSLLIISGWALGSAIFYYLAEHFNK
jgi:hypothetical protein